MTNINKNGKYNLPTIKLDAPNGYLFFSGRAHPENAEVEFAPVIEWINKYIENPHKNTTVELHLEYFNSTSAKVFLRILETLIEATDKTKLLIKWFYIDDDTYEKIFDFQEVLDYKFEIIEDV